MLLVAPKLIGVLDLPKQLEGSCHGGQCAACPRHRGRPGHGTAAGRCLRTSGYKVDLASDGDTGLALGRTADYVVMTVDRMLPRVDGLEVIQRLREHGIVTPTLIISALGEVDDRVRGLRAGGDDYLVKPFAFAELL